MYGERIADIQIETIIQEEDQPLHPSERRMSAERRYCDMLSIERKGKREVQVSELIQKLKKLDALKNQRDSMAKEAGEDTTNEQEYRQIQEEIAHEYPGMKAAFADLPYRSIHVLAPID